VADNARSWRKFPHRSIAGVHLRNCRLVPIAAHGLHKGERGHGGGIRSQYPGAERQLHAPALKERSTLGFSESPFGTY
jgi:hypothetical protein